MKPIKHIRKATSRDVLDILLMAIPEGRNVYGREDEAGVVVIRDTVTDVVYGVTIYGYSKYPDIWKKSLIDLGFGFIDTAQFADYLNEK